MPAEDDILEHMDPAVRQRVEAERAKYEPFLGLLSAWKLAVDEHLEHIETNVTARLSEQFFPEGDWRFPAQTVAVPEDLLARDISAVMAFTDPFTHAPWTPTGTGWTLPTDLVDWEFRHVGDKTGLVCTMRHESREPSGLPLSPERGQLALVPAVESVVAGLARAPWVIQYPEAEPLPLAVDRYRGYLEFEREMFVAGTAQRHLEAWLPPCHPYGRKLLNLHPLEERPGGWDPEQWAWLSDVELPPAPEDQRRFRIAALLDTQTVDELEADDYAPPLVLNAVPVAQMGVLTQPIVTTLHTVGDAYKVTFAGVSGFFAAAARAEEVMHRASFTRVPTSDPRGRADGGEQLKDIDVLCDQTATEVRTYYACLGEACNPGRDRPEYLTRPRGQRFSVPLPSVGGMDVGSRANPDAARSEWYHSLLRPSLLTEGDVIEILSHLPACTACFDLERASVQLDVVNEPWVERVPWETYLWPSVIAERSLLELRASYLTASRVPVIPVFRVWLQPRASEFPEFLLDDIARHSASVLSRHFMVGWYRVEGCVGETR